MNLLNYITEGKENAVSREQLVRYTGKTDRAIRREIRTLREDGVLICSNSRTGGYYLAETDEEKEEFEREQWSRIYSSLQTLNKWGKLESLDGLISQISFFTKEKAPADGGTSTSADEK